MRAVFIAIFLSLPFLLSSQERPDFDKIVQSAVDSFQQAWEAKVDYLTEYEKELSLEFALDTFRIEKLLWEKIDYDPSTGGMVRTLHEAEEQYDKLLNKYYQRLLKKLKEEDQEVLRETQRNWIQFRDSERKLNYLLAKMDYSGGGSIQSIFVADEYLSYTKKRVEEIYGYLLRFFE